MLKYFRIIVSNLKEDVLRNIIMVVFVGVSAFLMNVSLSRIMYQEYINSLVRDSGLYDNYMYSAPPDKSVYYENSVSDNTLNQRNVAQKYIREQLDNLKEMGIIEDYYSSAHFNAPISDDINDRADYILYPDELAVDINLPVSSGKWFDKYDFSDEFIPVVIGSNLSSRYKIGDVINSPYLEKTATVIGVLEHNAMVLSLGAGGNGMSLNEMFIIGNNMIVACVNEISEQDDIGGTVIKVPSLNQEEVLDCISDIAYTFSFKELSDRAYESNSLLTEMQFVVFVLMMIVCITGVSSSNLLETIYCKKRYAVYFLCGMDWTDSVKITLTEGLFKLIIPSIVGYIGFCKWCAEQDYYALRITNLNIIVTILLVLVVFLLTSLKPLLDIKNTSPVKIISQT